MTPVQLIERIRSDCGLLAKCFIDAGRHSDASQVLAASLALSRGANFSYSTSPEAAAHALVKQSEQCEASGECAEGGEA